LESRPASPRRTSTQELISALKQRLFPQSDRIVQWAAYAILFAVLVLYILDEPDMQNRQRFYGTILSLAALLLLNLFWDVITRFFSTDDKGEFVLLVASSLLTLLASWLGILYTGIYLVLMVSAQANIILHKFKAGLIFTLTLTAAYLVVVYLAGTTLEGMLGVALSLLTGLVFVIAISRVLVMYSDQAKRLEQLLEELKQTNAALIEARQKEQELAVAEERVRMARDIHDGLGHHLTVLSIQLQAASKLLASQPEKAAAAIELSRDEVQAALREVRQSVAALRQSPLDLQNISAEIANLVADFERLTGLPASLEISGEPVDISAASAQTLYRTVQEGLTNAQKHAAGATNVQVQLCWEASQARLVIQDDGLAVEEGSGEAGFGLAGIYERVHQLNGTVASGPLEEGGFRVQVAIPLRSPA